MKFVLIGAVTAALVGTGVLAQGGYDGVSRNLDKNGAWRQTGDPDFIRNDNVVMGDGIIGSYKGIGGSNAAESTITSTARFDFPFIPSSMRESVNPQ